MNATIRPENVVDHDAIRHVIRLAFGQDEEARQRRRRRAAFGDQSH
jgi:hypothetical protein